MRPPVSIVVPFYGSLEDAEDLRSALARVTLDEGDEIVVSDNTEDGRFPDTGVVTVARAPLERSSYYARNVGVESTKNAWLLFLDSDCRPAPDIVGRYFDPPPADSEGLLSGGVVAAEQEELIARYAQSRGHIDPTHYRNEHRRHAGITANLLVRREAWDAVGGFQEGVRSGADLEFCWRAQDAGFGFGWRTEATTEHVHVDTLKRLVRKTVRHAGGGGWVNRRYPDAFPRPRLAYGIARALVGLVAWPLLLQPRRGLFKGIDGVFLACDAYGRLISNGAWRDVTAPVPPAPSPVLVVDTFADAAGAATLATMATVRVEARARPWRPERAVRREVWAAFAEDHGPLERARDLGWLLARRPAAWRAVARLGAGEALAAAPAARRLRTRGDGPLVVPAGDPGASLATAIAALGGARVEHRADVAASAAASTRSAFLA